MLSTWTGRGGKPKRRCAGPITRRPCVTILSLFFALTKSVLAPCFAIQEHSSHASVETQIECSVRAGRWQVWKGGIVVAAADDVVTDEFWTALAEFAQRIRSVRRQNDTTQAGTPDESQKPANHGDASKNATRRPATISRYGSKRATATSTPRRDVLLRRIATLDSSSAHFFLNDSLAS